MWEGGSITLGGNGVGREMDEGNSMVRGREHHELGEKGAGKELDKGSTMVGGREHQGGREHKARREHQVRREGGEEEG